MLARMQRIWITQTFANRNVKWNSHSRNGHGTFSTGLNMPLPCDPAVALLASTPEMITLCPHKNLYTDFITVKNPNVLQWVKGLTNWYIHTMEYYSAIKTRKC